MSEDRREDADNPDAEIQEPFRTASFPEDRKAEHEGDDPEPRMNADGNAEDAKTQVELRLFGFCKEHGGAPRGREARFCNFSQPAQTATMAVQSAKPQAAMGQAEVPGGSTRRSRLRPRSRTT